MNHKEIQIISGYISGIFRDSQGRQKSIQWNEKLGARRFVRTGSWITSTSNHGLKWPRSPTRARRTISMMKNDELTWADLGLLVNTGSLHAKETP